MPPTAPATRRRNLRIAIAAGIAVVTTAAAFGAVKLLALQRDRDERAAADDRVDFLASLPVPDGSVQAETFAPATDSDRPGLATLSYTVPADLVADCSIVLDHAADRRWTVLALVYGSDGTVAYRPWTSSDCPTTASVPGPGLAMLDQLFLSGDGIDADEPLRFEADVQGPAQWEWSVGYDLLEFPRVD